MLQCGGFGGLSFPLRELMLRTHTSPLTSENCLSADESIQSVHE